MSHLFNGSVRRCDYVPREGIHNTLFCVVSKTRRGSAVNTYAYEIMAGSIVISKDATNTCKY